MKKLTMIVYVVFTLALSACSDSSTNAGNLDPSISCADVYNEGTSSTCNGNTPAGTIFVDAGTVTRLTIIAVTIEVNNPTNLDINGYAEIKFDAGCNGAPTWEVLSKQPFVFPANEVYIVNAGGACGDMPLGDRTATGTAWLEDGETIIDDVVVNFTLIE